jgi:TRC40/GET3/ArsA family transport-energizing ATPase
MLRRASALCPALALFAVALPVAVAFSPSLPAPAGRFCSSGRLPIAVRPALSAPSPFTYAPGTSARSAALSLRQGLRSAKASGAPDDESLQRLVGLPGRRYIFVGGKGGVGKTSTSAATAVKFADEGLRTLVISTDPAHSLGDALATDLSSGKVTPISEQGGFLYALEVDLKEAVEEFQRIIAGLRSEETDSIAAKLGLSEMTDIFDTAPPGADELVALSKVISLVEEGEAKTALGESISFDRIVIDTAPTGHTLRLLEYPRFISRLITKVLSLKGKLGSSLDVVGQAASFLGAQLGFKAPDKETIKQGGQKLNEKAERFRDRMQVPPRPPRTPHPTSRGCLTRRRVRWA